MRPRPCLLLMLAALTACAPRPPQPALAPAPAPTPPAPAPTPPPAPAPPPTPPPPATPIQLGPGLLVDRQARELRIDAEVAIDRGWLEQAVCTVETRDYESLLATRVPASRIHAGLLLLGLEPGQPGRWREVPGAAGAPATVERVPPTGAPLAVLVQVGSAAPVPLSAWIAEPSGRHAFPAQPWVFAGSRMRQRPARLGGGEQYAADGSGSIVGIVTFGDECIACEEVIADRIEVDAPQWQARTGTVPAPGTPATLILRPR